MSHILYETYMKEVDRILIKKTGLEHSDLPDWKWVYTHEQGTSFKDAVDFFLEDTDIVEYIEGVTGESKG